MVATALAGLATALPQTATASSAPAAETTPSVAELEAIPMEFPPLDPKAEPVEGKSNETLLVAAPYLEEIVESAPDLNTTLTKRSVRIRLSSIRFNNVGNACLRGDFFAVEPLGEERTV